MVGGCENRKLTEDRGSTCRLSSQIADFARSQNAIKNEERSCQSIFYAICGVLYWLCNYLNSSDPVPCGITTVLVAARYAYIVTFPRRLQICLMSVNLRIYRLSDLHRSDFYTCPCSDLSRLFGRALGCLPGGRAKTLTIGRPPCGRLLLGGF